MKKSMFWAWVLTIALILCFQLTSVADAIPSVTIEKINWQIMEEGDVCFPFDNNEYMQKKFDDEQMRQYFVEIDVRVGNSISDYRILDDIKYDVRIVTEMDSVWMSSNVLINHNDLGEVAGDTLITIGFYLYCNLDTLATDECFVMLQDNLVFQLNYELYYLWLNVPVKDIYQKTLMFDLKSAEQEIYKFDVPTVILYNISQGENIGQSTRWRFDFIETSFSSNGRYLMGYLNNDDQFLFTYLEDVTALGDYHIEPDFSANNLTGVLGFDQSVNADIVLSFIDRDDIQIYYSVSNLYYDGIFKNYGVWRPVKLDTN